MDLLLVRISELQYEEGSKIEGWQQILMLIFMYRSKSKEDLR